MVNATGCLMLDRSFHPNETNNAFTVWAGEGYFSGVSIGDIPAGGRLTVVKPSWTYFWPKTIYLYERCGGQSAVIVDQDYLPYNGNVVLTLRPICSACARPPINDDDDLPPSPDYPKSPDTPPTSPDDRPTSDCIGMPVWRVSEPYISIWIHDEPLGYKPSIGPRISLELSYKQRESSAGLDTSIFGVGKYWNLSWLSYVKLDSSTNKVVDLPGGGQRTFYATNDYLTNAKLTGDTTNGYTLTYAAGGKDVYGFIVTNSSGVFQKAFLTERWNAQAQKTTLNYGGYIPASPVIKLLYVIDGDGRTNTICYQSGGYTSPLIKSALP